MLRIKLLNGSSFIAKAIGDKNKILKYNLDSAILTLTKYKHSNNSRNFLKTIGNNFYVN